MTFVNQADETRRQAREGKEKGVPEARQARPPIEGEKVKYVDVFVDGGSGGNNSSTESGSGDDGGDGETTETQGATENTSSGGSSSTGGSGTTFNADDPSTWAQEAGTGGSISGDDMEAATSTEGETCIGCDVEEMDGITEGDCAGGSGDCFKIHYDGVFPPPEGWSDPDTAPEDPGWTEGAYWKNSDANPACEVPQKTLGAAKSFMKSMIGFNQGGCFTNDDVYGPFWTNETTSGISPNRQFSGWLNWYQTPELDGSTFHLQTSIREYPCATNGLDTYCSSEPPLLGPEWPDDGCYDLVFDGLAFKGHDLDPNLPDKFKGAGTSSVDYCTDGGADGATRTGVDGGFQIDTSNMIRVYDAEGNLVAAGDKTQTFKERYQP